MRIQRRVVRWAVHKDAKVQAPGNETFVPAVIHDISLKGMRVALDDLLPTRIGFLLTAVLPDQEKIECDAWAVWRREAGARRYYGLYFTRLNDTDKEKICRFIRREYPQSLNTDLQGPVLDQGHVSDRHFSQRFRLACPVEVTDRACGVAATGETVDFSSNGIGLCLQNSIEPGREVLIQLSLPHQTNPLPSTGTVMWSNLTPRGFRVGIRLDHDDLIGLPQLLRLC